MITTAYALMNKVLEQKYPVIILFGIFLVFLLSGISALDVRLLSKPEFGFNPQILTAVISNILRQPLHPGSLNLIWILTGGIALAVLLPVTKPVTAALLTLLISLPPVYSGIAAQGTTTSIIPMEYCLLIIFMLFSINALLAYFSETSQRQRIVELFGRYVPPHIVAEISRQKQAPDLEGEVKQLSVLFCDIKNFSHVAEQLNPKQLTRLLNEYFDAMTEVLFQHGATIDKYIGDSIMAFWGAPLPQADHAERAVHTAFAMHKKISSLSATFIRRGWPGPDMGAGINTGLMNVGNMGSKHRMAYTVIGDAVNLASRIEALTREYRVPTLVSESTMNECNSILFREIDVVQVKGKHNSTKIYQPLCPADKADDRLRRQLELHRQGLDYYYSGQLDSARGIYTVLNEQAPEDGYYGYMVNKSSGRNNSGSE